MVRCSPPIFALLLSTLALTSAGCRRSPSSSSAVACWWIDGSVLCDVSNKRGPSALDICWDVAFECRNGTKVSGSACQVVQQGKTEQKRITPASLMNGPKCNGADSIGVAGLRQSPAPSGPTP